MLLGINIMPPPPRQTIFLNFSFLYLLLSCLPLSFVLTLDRCNFFFCNFSAKLTKTLAPLQYHLLIFDPSRDTTLNLLLLDLLPVPGPPKLSPQLESENCKQTALDPTLLHLE